MRKKLTFNAGKIVRSCLTAVLALTLAVPATGMMELGKVAADKTVKAEAADAELPDPIMSLDFNKGFQGEKDNGLAVKESKRRLFFNEVKDEKGNYINDANGKLISEWTDKPVIYGTSEADYHYYYGVVGNQPVTAFDKEKGNVFELDSSMDIPAFVKKEEDVVKKVPVYTAGYNEDGTPKDQAAYDASLLQEPFTADSAATIKNPFAGMDFTETPGTDGFGGPVWTNGVTISYWVKVPEAVVPDDADPKKVYNDSVLLTFENIQRPEGINQSILDPDGDKVTYEVNGLIKHDAALAYKADDPLYAQGTRETVTDINTGTTYTVAKDYGPLVRLTPDYEGSATNKIYFIDEESKATPAVTIKTLVDGSLKDVNLFELGPNIRNDYISLDTKEGSLVTRGYINGSMQFSASDTFHFKEDDYYSKQTLDENGNPIGIPVQGAFDINPNNEGTDGVYRQLRYYNAYYFNGDETVTNAPNVWHFVTIVIQNDWVQYYVDGESIEADDLSFFEDGFGSLNAKKYFNKGFGIRHPFEIGTSNVADWSKNGTFSNGPSNCVPQTMLEWLSNEDTVLTIGGQGICAESVTQDIGTLDGVQLDDLSFYAVPLDENQATALYENAVATKDAEAQKLPDATKESDDVPAPVKVYTFDNDAQYSMPAGMTASDTNNADKVDVPQVVNDETYGHTLRNYASKSTVTSAVKFENPFAGMNIEGATVSYWVKAADASKDGVGLSFMDEPKILEHGKIQEAVKDTLTRTGLYTQLSADATFMAGRDSKIYDSLKNNYQQSTKKNGNTTKDEPGYDEDAKKLEDEWNARLSSMTSWHFVTMTLTNEKITMYFDGEKLACNLEDANGPAFYGPRFFDGYYVKYLDSFKALRTATSNQTATTLMSFLTQADTACYIGMMYKLGSNSVYMTTPETAYDDITFYDVALSENQAKAVYQKAVTAASAKTPVAGENIDGMNGGGGNTVPTPAPSSDPIPDKKTEKEESSFVNGTATANGVTVTGADGVIPEGAVLVVSKLGTQDAADRYTAANSAFKTAGIDLSTYVNTIYDIHIEVNGQTVAPNGSVNVKLTPPTGYVASKTSIIRVNDVKSMATTVSGSALVYDTDALGEFAVLQTKGANSTISGNSSTTGSSVAGKTGDAASVVVPLILLFAAFCVIVAVRRKEEALED